MYNPDIKTKELDIDYNKSLNSICICKTGLPWKKDNVVMLYPCEHILHETCYKTLHNNICSICNTPIKQIFRITDKDIHHQRFADLLSVSYYSDMCTNKPDKFIDSIFDTATVLARLPFTKGRQSGKDLCEQILSLNNTTIKVYGMNKLKLEKRKVFICNHVSLLDPCLIYYLFGTGFLSSAKPDEGYNFISQIKNFVPLLLISRGDKTRKVNCVDEMKRYVDQNGSICVFPEGMLKHPDAIIRFRTGAFNTGHPLYPIVIRYNDVLGDGYIDQLIYKMGGKKDILIEVHVLGPYYPPFNENHIEQIRSDMARVGKMILSRVTSRDIKD